MSNIERKPEHKPKPCHVMVALDGEPRNIVPADAVVPMIYEVMEYVPASQLAGAVDALHEALDAARTFNRGGMTWLEYDALLVRLASQHPRGQ